MNAPLKIFLSYAHEDEIHRETLGKHLRELAREGLVDIWHDRMITGGREWAGVIDAALKSADIVLLLISADFLDSDYCNDKELTEALRMHDGGTARVVPVILRSSDWEHSKFARLNALPPDGRPIVEAEHPDQRFTAVAKGLRDIVAEIHAERAPASTEQSAPPGETQGQPLPRKPRRIKVDKIKVWFLEFGPIEFNWPPTFRAATLRWGMLWAALLIALGLMVAYVIILRAPIAEARDYLRIARYDLALQALSKIPSWLQRWPGVAFLGSKAELGQSASSSKPDWEKLNADLRRMLATHPNDATLQVLEATREWRVGDSKKATKHEFATTQADDNYAEAWYLLGLGEDILGNLDTAEKHYRKALEKGPDSAQYHNNLARVLLDQGKVDDAIVEYQRILRFPLARVEEALAYWAKGDVTSAAERQASAIKMLQDEALQGEYYNRRTWEFWFAGKGVRLPTLEEKRCYASLEAAASGRLAGRPDIAFPPVDCPHPPLHIRELVADDLCRFVDAPRAAPTSVTGLLRQSLGQPQGCNGG